MSNPPSTVYQLGRLRDVLNRTGSGRSTHYKQIHDGLMVPPIQIGARAAAYPAHEIDAIIAARIAGESDDKIRALVTRLVAQRALAGTEHHEQSLPTEPHDSAPGRVPPQPGRVGRIREVEPLA